MYLGGIPIISLDKIYLVTDDRNVLFLDCTRLDGSKKLVSRNNLNRFDNVEWQIKMIADRLKDIGLNEIILADDVVFSGSVLKSVIQEFLKNGIKVLGIRSAVATITSYEIFKELPLGLKCTYLLGRNFIDQVCERDFYFGVAQSGISVLQQDGFIYKAPYFVPFGNPVERASISEMYRRTFSRGCLRRSIALWSEIERLSKRKFYIRDLPEKITLVNDEEEIVKTLKKELRRI